MSDYPKLATVRLATVRCAICHTKITLIIKLEIRTPLLRDGLNPLPFDPEPTVLGGCQHFYDREAKND